MGAARTVFVGLPMLCALIATIFGILTLIGGMDKPGLRDVYFVRINTTDFYPESASPFATLINSVADSLGLQNYYQSSLWNYCSGSLVNGSTTQFASPSFCSDTSADYWFDPVTIIQSDLPSTFSFSLPQDTIDDLDVLRTAQTWLKAILVVGTCFSFLTISASIFAFRSRCGSLFASIIAFIGALFTVAGAIVAQIIGIVVRKVVNGLTDVDLEATLGTKFYIFVWLSAGFSLVYWLLLTFTICCCTPQSTKDKRRGRAARKQEKDIESI